MAEGNKAAGGNENIKDKFLEAFQQPIKVRNLQQASHSFNIEVGFEELNDDSGTQLSRQSEITYRAEFSTLSV